MEPTNRKYPDQCYKGILDLKSAIRQNMGTKPPNDTLDMHFSVVATNQTKTGAERLKPYMPHRSLRSANWTNSTSSTGEEGRRRYIYLPLSKEGE